MGVENLQHKHEELLLHKKKWMAYRLMASVLFCVCSSCQVLNWKIHAGNNCSPSFSIRNGTAPRVNWQFGQVNSECYFTLLLSRPPPMMMTWKSQFVVKITPKWLWRDTRIQLIPSPITIFKRPISPWPTDRNCRTINFTHFDCVLLFDC